MIRFLDNKPTEEQLVERCLNGERKAQRQLFERFSGKMMAACLRYAGNRADAEDCMIQGFEKVFRALPMFQQLGSLEGWIRRIMVREALTMVRKKTLLFAETSEEVENQGQWPDWASELEASELMALVQGLPEGYRLVFNLYAIEGYSHEEIADMLAISAVTSRSQLSRARALLQKQIVKLEKPTGREVTL
jgi:RNA polymerase sigma-70 factor (ECF subfamily)